MILYLLRRSTTWLITLFFLLQLSFCVVFLSKGAPLCSLPLSDAYLLYFSSLWRGDISFAITDSQEVLATLKMALPATIELCLLAFTLSLLIGIPLGIILGINSGKRIDKLLKTLSVFATATPLIWLSLIVIMLFTINLNYLPTFSSNGAIYKPNFITGFTFIDVWFMPKSVQGAILLSSIKQLLLPIFVLSLAPIVTVIRLMQFSTEHIVQQNYIKAASCRGLNMFTIAWRHILHNAIPPIIPQLGIQFSMMLTLTMFTEIMFNRPGLGLWALDAYHQQEYAVIALVLLTSGLLISTTSMIGDIIGVAADPFRHKEKYALQ